jgi:hypothetical protein
LRTSALLRSFAWKTAAVEEYEAGILRTRVLWEMVPPEAVVMLEEVWEATEEDPVQPVVVKVLSVPVAWLDRASVERTR